MTWNDTTPHSSEPDDGCFVGFSVSLSTTVSLCTHLHLQGRPCGAWGKVGVTAGGSSLEALQRRKTWSPYPKSSGCTARSWPAGCPRWHLCQRHQAYRHPSSPDCSRKRRCNLVSINLWLPRRSVFLHQTVTATQTATSCVCSMSCHLQCISCPVGLTCVCVCVSTVVLYTRIQNGITAVTGEEVCTTYWNPP